MHKDNKTRRVMIANTVLYILFGIATFTLSLFGESFLNTVFWDLLAAWWIYQGISLAKIIRSVDKKVKSGMASSVKEQAEKAVTYDDEGQTYEYTVYPCGIDGENVKCYSNTLFKDPAGITVLIGILENDKKLILREMTYVIVNVKVRPKGKAVTSS